jgi:hypothetical protein
VPGASLVRFVTLAALIVSVALALWLLDVHRAWIAAGVVVAWLVATLIEWIAWSRVEPRGADRRPGYRRTVPSPARSPSAAARAADEPTVRSFRLFGFRVTLRAKPKKAPSVESPPPAAAPTSAEPEPVAEPAAGAPPPVGKQRSGGPRRWNLWELERAARDRPVTASAEAEERSLLLLHLRRFAAPDGLLPVEFDALVRHAFPSLVGDLEEA